MKAIETFARYLIIIDKLERTPSGVPTDELKDHVNKELHIRSFKSVDLRTLQRDFENINYEFGLEIKNSSGKYYMEPVPGFIHKRDEEMLLNFDLLTAIGSDSKLQKYVLAEHHRPIGSPGQIPPLLEAIRNTHVIEFDYVLYRHEGNAVHKQVNPHFLKESNQRWYLLAMDGDTLKCFGIDRITNLKIHYEQKFARNEDMDIDALFRDNYGIWNDPQMPIEDIELAYDALDGRFLKSMPLHHSQQILEDTPSIFRISLRLRITNDFVMELLSRSRSLTVIKPESLRQRMADIYRDALKRNSTENTI